MGPLVLALVSPLLALVGPLSAERSCGCPSGLRGPTYLGLRAGALRVAPRLFLARLRKLAFNQGGRPHTGSTVPQVL